MKALIQNALCACLLFVPLTSAATTWQAVHFGINEWPSSGQCRLESSSITVNLHSYSADVTEEAVISTSGDVYTGDPATLEITGDFQLSEGSALRSMLLWNGTKILKAKLLDRAAADSAYEDVVDRDSIVWVSRDPALISYTGSNNYHYSIYPVAINGSRKIRILYTVPLKSVFDGPRFQIKSAFAGGCSSFPENIPVKISADDSDTGSVVLGHGNELSPLCLNATYLIPQADLVPQSRFDYNSYEYVYTGGMLEIIRSLPPASRAYCTGIAAGSKAGNYSAIFCSAPSVIAETMKEQLISTWALQALIVSGDETYIADHLNDGALGIYLKTEKPWDGKIKWIAYNTASGKILMQQIESIVPETDTAMVADLPLVWAARYSFCENQGGLGAVYGFVDEKMSLLALEKDTLSKALSAVYRDGGMPLLKPEEIIVAAEDLPAVPRNVIIIERTALMQNPGSLLTGFSVKLLGSATLQLTLDGLDNAEIAVCLYDLSGRLIQSWSDVGAKGGLATLSLDRHAAGAFVVRVTAGAKTSTAQLILP